MHGWAVFIIVVVILAALAGGAFYAYARIYKKRQGNAPSFPAPAPSGVGDWIKDKWHAIRNPKTSTGAGYEGAGYDAPGGGYRGGRRGNALDPDEAWDTRVGNEADVYGPGGYYEEQELGLHQPTAYHGGGAGGFQQTNTLGAGAAGDRGRSKSPAGSNPFGDENAAGSLRGVSPRPDLGLSTKGHGKGKSSAESSPTFERRSMFREEM